MPLTSKTTLALLLATLAAAPALAQEQSGDVEAQAEDAAPADEADEASVGDTAPETAEDAGGETRPEETLGLSMGENAAEADTVGQTYARETFGDWEMRCVRTESGDDPCQLYQLLKDEEGNNVAEISIFPLPEEGEAVAGATVITPLDTLLTAQVGLRVDGGGVKRYPFTWCSAIGCFSRIGLTQEDVDAFRRGRAATMTIRPVAAPDQTVDLTIGLSGFTDGFDAVESSNDALPDE